MSVRPVRSNEGVPARSEAPAPLAGAVPWRRWLARWVVCLAVLTAWIVVEHLALALAMPGKVHELFFDDGKREISELGIVARFSDDGLWKAMVVLFVVGACPMLAFPLKPPELLTWLLCILGGLVALMIAATVYLKWYVGLVELPPDAAKPDLLEVRPAYVACLSLALFLAPVAGWVGMPWAKGQRLGWSLCLATSALVVFFAACLTPIKDDASLLEYLCHKYNGPRLSPEYHTVEPNAGRQSAGSIPSPGK